MVYSNLAKRFASPKLDANPLRRACRIHAEAQMLEQGSPYLDLASALSLTTAEQICTRWLPEIRTLRYRYKMPHYESGCP